MITHAIQIASKTKNKTHAIRIASKTKNKNTCYPDSIKNKTIQPCKFNKLVTLPNFSIYYNNDK